LTVPLAARIPAPARPAVLAAIRLVHTVAFFSIGMCIIVYVWEGVRGRAGRRAAASLSVALAEAFVYLSNNQVCPLTPLAEELGADDGAVVDMYLPRWLSSRIPQVSTTMLIVGLGLSLRALRRRSGD
jgi:hypothetical protein